MDMTGTRKTRVHSHENFTRYLLIGFPLRENIVSGGTIPQAWQAEPSTTMARRTSTLVGAGVWRIIPRKDLFGGFNLALVTLPVHALARSTPPIFEFSARWRQGAWLIILFWLRVDHTIDSIYTSTDFTQWKAQRKDLRGEKRVFIRSLAVPVPHLSFHVPYRDCSTQTDELTYEDIDAIAQYLKGKTSVTPDIGVICGSGLGGLGEILDQDKQKDTIPYNEIPNFPKTTGSSYTS